MSESIDFINFNQSILETSENTLNVRTERVNLIHSSDIYIPMCTETSADQLQQSVLQLL